ncbi:TolC family protein [Ramlibacter tataouinensis]|uniref:Protein cyaE-like protein n=1 Tax=Ramlibacter tataouinensis (strain ATCC BAA-407 / DSM 14655 / LMG 21543 / TTB310) TaxID=365046 RepID=F5XZV2_RAMTT|nr:TolC family protein [Ramlibacter tataouinensis]AEG93313.1 protein cyaE-like protein [Ramlibacter tataouinensis TTB310]
MKARRSRKLAVALTATLVLAGCAAPNMDAALREANSMARPVAGGASATLARDDAGREASAKLAAAILSKPLTMDGAAQLALANSPAFQSALAQSWGELAQARQRGLPGGVVFSFERLREGADLEIGRLLSIGLFDLITLPQRRAASQLDGEHARVRMASSIVEQVSNARQAWVKAVAASEIEVYAVQVQEAADASAELARRLQGVGNFTKLQAARQHLFYGDATSRLASARQAAVSAREELVRQLGLTDEQAAGLKLPERLPDLPKAPKAPDEVSKALASQRLDARIARLELEAAGRGRGVDLVSSLVDVEAGVRRDTLFEGNGERASVRGFELEIRLPLFDWGATRRAALDARSLAAANRYEALARAASSQARESYSAYRTAYDQARHQREEMVPLRKTISEENLLRYNGMLIGVFELLADARDQVNGVIASIEAQRDFWLADAALSSTLIGRPMAGGAASAPAAGAAAGSNAAAH